ncbi:hypothetical protein GCM10011360_44470 [Primorskyibacter flagellatus]|jgi:hypothetical protein|uniref:Uncharacterized protein n=1 Tax=Primorskyibacter flagellatus TaxID=1387277 RepID=A0A917AH79_9RHOB|nr:hypothetical protein GCM10011360_44470 [Primorskyibacter flagellatus]
MAMRGPEAYQQTELGGSCTNAAFSDPDLIDPLPLLFSDLLTLPTYRDVVACRLRYAIAATGFR